MARKEGKRGSVKSTCCLFFDGVVSVLDTFRPWGQERRSNLDPIVGLVV